MTTLVLSVIAVLMLGYLAFKSPPSVLFVYLLTCGTNDAMGVSSYLRASGFDIFVQLAKGPLLIAAFIAFLKIRKDYQHRAAGRQTLYAAWILAGCHLWIFFGAALKGEPYWSIGSFVIYTGLPAGLIALAFRRDQTAKSLFVLALGTQLYLSAILLLFPNGPLSTLSARYYQLSDAGLEGTVDQYEGAIARTGNQERLFAQHYNPQAYGLYAIVGSVVGGRLLLAGGSIGKRLAGGAVLFAGCFGWSVTVPRGATIGVLVGGAVVLGRSIRRWKVSSSVRASMVLLAAMSTVAAMILPIPWGELWGLFAVSGDDVGFVARLEAAERGVRGIMDFPLFGMPPEDLNRERIIVHQIMLYFALAFGLPAGAACTWLLASGVVANRVVYPQGRGRRVGVGGRMGATFGEMNMSTMLTGAIIGMGLTNNFAASLLYWSAWATAFVPFRAERSGRSLDVRLHGRAGPTESTIVNNIRRLSPF